MKTKKWTNEIWDIPLQQWETSDYLYLLSKWVSPEAREKFRCWDIFINWAVCLKCKDYIRSTNWYNFKTCSCGAVSVDWGSWYCRRVWNSEDYINVIENFTYINTDDEL